MRIIFLIIILTFSFCKGQENKNFLFLHSGVSVYIGQKDGSFIRKDYKIDDYEKSYSLEEGSTSQYIPKNETELNNLKNNSVKPSYKTENILKDFEKNKNNFYQIIDKEKNTVVRFGFFGSKFFIEKNERLDNHIPVNFLNEKLMIPPKKWNSNLESGYKYKLYENFQNTGVNLFILNKKVYAFNSIEELMENIFPNTNVKVANQKFSTQFFAFNIKIEEKFIDENTLYGVIDDLGKEILEPKFDKILICADAILAKEKSLWFFYDFFGNKIIKKGYRKILPLKSTYSVKQYDEPLQITKDGLITYSVLEKNSLMQISDIYKNTNVDFVNYWGMYSVCGTRSGSWSETSSKISIAKNNTIEFEKTTYLFNSNYASVKNVNEKTLMKNLLQFSLHKEIGKVKFLNKKDSTNHFNFGYNNPVNIFFKVATENKEYILPISFSCPDKTCGQLMAMQLSGFRNEDSDYEKIEYFDKIEELESENILLNIGGDYEWYNLPFDNFYVNNNFYPNTYYKLYRDGKVAFYSPRALYIGFLNFKYRTLENLENRFLKFEDVNGKKGLLSEDGEEFYFL